MKSRQTIAPLICLAFLACSAPEDTRAAISGPEDASAGLALPTELGRVRWERDFDAALTRADSAEKPILLLFQEVPGWQTCKDFGTQVLSHALIVEAAETLFVPAAVYNNTDGDADAAVLESFDEAAWNNPVVRVIDARRRDLGPRFATGWQVSGMAHTLRAGLSATPAGAPNWFSAFDSELDAHRRGVATAVFGMTWYWVGEAKFGALDGVLTTFSGWKGEIEVVQLEYDPRVVTYAELCARALELGACSIAFPATADEREAARLVFGDKSIESSDDVRRVDDTKYYLLEDSVRFVPLTEHQATRLNAMDAPRDYASVLSPRQLERLEFVRAHPEAPWRDALGIEFLEASEAYEQTRAQLPRG